MIRFLKNKASQKIIFPFYHTVSNSKLNHISPLYNVKSVVEFKKGLGFLLKHFRPIDLQTAIAYSEAKSETKITDLKPSFHLTFDDGLAECYTVIAPILKELNIPATFFINSDFIGNKKLFYRFKIALLITHKNVNKLGKELNCLPKEVAQKLKELRLKDEVLINHLAKKIGLDFKDYLEKEQPFMTSVQIKELQQQGFTIGAHSVDHPFYKDLTFEEQISQTEISIKRLQEELNIPIKSFAFPFTNDGVEQKFYDYFNPLPCFGTSGIRNFNRNKIERIPMENISKFGMNPLQYAYFSYLMKHQ